MKSKVPIYLLLASILLTFTSCGKSTKMDENYLKNITEYYRENGMTSWWEVLAVYNADENPIDYKGFDDITAKLAEGGTTSNMATYLIVAGVAADIGADIGYFEEVETFGAKLKAKIEACDGSEPINMYAFIYYGLKACNIEFSGETFISYLQSKQCADGGFTYSGDSGDIDLTSQILPILRLYAKPELSRTMPEDEMYFNALHFIENNIQDDGTFESYGSKNANSTATALSALILSENIEIVEKAKNGLSTFTVKSADGFAFKQGGERDVMATYQAAIALGDYNKKTCLFYEILNIESD